MAGVIPEIKNMDLTSNEVYKFFLIMVTNCVAITGVVFELNFKHVSPVDIAPLRILKLIITITPV